MQPAFGRNYKSKLGIALAVMASFAISKAQAQGRHRHLAAPVKLAQNTTTLVPHDPLNVEPVTSQTPQTQTQPSSSTLATTINPPTKRKPVVKWNLSLMGTSFANEKEQAQTAGFGVGAEIKYRLVESLHFKATAGLTMQSGYAQSRFGDNTPRTGLDLREAYLQWRPLRPFMIEVGALDQGQLRLPLLVSARPFPGVAERILIGDRRLGAELRAQQVVPTSTTLATKTVDAEPSPSLLTETLRLSAMPFDQLTLKANATHFVFNQLPSKVALDSSVFGNTLDPDEQRFKYEFQGFAVGGGAKVDFTRRFAWNIDGHVMQNIDAPEGYRMAQLASTGFEIGLTQDVTLVPQAEMFFAESDVAPAFYNDSGYGHTNRQGWAADVSATFKQAGIKLGARFVNADLISQQINQSSQQYLMIRFETLYDSLL
jgi:hypothetical protein